MLAGDDCPRLTVIIPTYNRAGELAGQLDALTGQDYPQWWEVVVVDNRCTDRTREVLAGYRDRLPLRVVDADRRQGRPHAVNVGAAVAEGDALLWLDDDDVIAPGYLLAMGAALARNPFVGARLDSYPLNPPWLRARRRPVQEAGLPILFRHRPFVVGAALGVSKAAFDQVGGCDETLECLEDIDLSWRLQEAGYHPIFVPDAVVRYRYRQDLAGLWRQERSYGRWEAALYAKHRGSGLPRRRVRTTLAGWAQIVYAVRDAHTRAGRARLVTVAGAATGRMLGSLRSRILYL